MEAEHHPAGRYGQSFRLDRDHARRRHPWHHYRFDGANQLAQGEYITLLADIAAGSVIDIPPAVCSRYYACILTPGSGQVEVNINVNANTLYGQYMYVTGNTGTLGNWNTNLGIPVDPRSIRCGGTRSTWPPAVPSSTNITERTRTVASSGNATRATVIATETDR